MEPETKEILISNDRQINDIQCEFSACYPFLKIEFLAAANKPKNGKVIFIKPQTLIKQFVNINPCRININRDRTVAEVSHDMQNILGVPVQVLRKSGNVWSTISISDNWTLQSQNVAGEYISSEMALNTN